MYQKKDWLGPPHQSLYLIIWNTLYTPWLPLGILYRLYVLVGVIPKEGRGPCPPILFVWQHKDLQWVFLQHMPHIHNHRVRDYGCLTNWCVKVVPYSENCLVFMFNGGSSSSLTICPIDKKIGMEGLPYCWKWMSSYLPNSQNHEYKVAPPDTIWHYLKSPFSIQVTDCTNLSHLIDCVLA